MLDGTVSIGPSLYSVTGVRIIQKIGLMLLGTVSIGLSLCSSVTRVRINQKIGLMLDGAMSIGPSLCSVTGVCIIQKIMLMPDGTVYRSFTVLCVWSSH